MVDVPKLHWEPIDRGEDRLAKELSQGMALNSFVNQRAFVEDIARERRPGDLRKAVAAAEHIVDELSTFITRSTAELEQLEQGENNG